MNKHLVIASVLVLDAAIYFATHSFLLAFSLLLLAFLVHLVYPKVTLYLAKKWLNKRNAIYRLAQAGDIEGLKKLTTDARKAESAIFPAIDEGNVEIVKEMLKFPKININARDRQGNTPLIYACYLNQLEIVKVLVEAGADLEARSKAEISPLIACIMKNRLPIGEYLLIKGVKIDLTTKIPAMRYIVKSMSFDFKILLRNHIKRRSMMRVLYPYYKRSEIDPKDWPELFRIAEKCPYVLRSACKYLAREVDLEEHLNYQTY